MIQPQRGCVHGRNPFRVETRNCGYPGLKQPWALRRNRFAVKAMCVHVLSGFISDRCVALPGGLQESSLMESS